MTYIICCIIICITTVILTAIVVSKPITIRRVQEYIDHHDSTEPPEGTPLGFKVPEDNTDVLGDMMGDAMDLFTGGDRIEENKE